MKVQKLPCLKAQFKLFIQATYSKADKKYFRSTFRIEVHFYSFTELNYLGKCQIA